LVFSEASIDNASFFSVRMEMLTRIPRPNLRISADKIFGYRRNENNRNVRTKALPRSEIYCTIWKFFIRSIYMR